MCFLLCTGNGSVTPRLVNSWLRNWLLLSIKPEVDFVQDGIHNAKITHKSSTENNLYRSQVSPVRTWESLAKVMPGNMCVKKVEPALVNTSWLNYVQSNIFLFPIFRTSYQSNRDSLSAPSFENNACTRVGHVFRATGCTSLYFA